MKKETVKEVKLSELSNMARVLAEINIKERGEYFCTIGGQKVRVTK